jgi:hypothetical protein
MVQAVSQGLSAQRPGIAPRIVHVIFMVDKAILRQVLLRVLRFSPAIIIPPWLSILIYHSGGGGVAAFQRYSLTPSARTTTISSSAVSLEIIR